MITWNKEQILAVLENPDYRTGTLENRYIIYRMLQSMYNRQTVDEQNAEFTLHHNNIGFNGPDSRLLSSIASESKRYNNLTIRQAFLVAKKMKKYWRQLVEIAETNTTAKAA